MKTYSILITTPPFHGDTAKRAFAFIKGVLDNGDTVSNVFFYSDGVLHANSLMLQTSDELYAYNEWKALAENHNITLLVCITAAVKRGIVSEQEAIENGLSIANLVSPFEQAGLGEFFSELHNCDRLVQF
ncbi:MAG: sulfur relay protein TusD [Alteromonas sp. Nap_26]|nr:MAG: sulfur relay protein TusD [Alteromonas sp. Nap_26]